jgi:hypothetical protein
MSRQRERATRDDGVIMPIALAFVTFIALIIAALLTQSASQFRASQAFNTRQDGVFAADAGLERALAGVDMISDPPAPGLTPVLSSNEQAFRSQFVLFGNAEVTYDDFTVTAAGGSHRLAVVAVANNDSHPAVSVDFGPHAMHRLGTASSSGQNSTSLWYLLLDGEFNPDLAPGNYDITVHGGAGLFETIGYAIHASSWTGVLQQVEGTPFGPTDTARTSSGTAVSSLSSPVSTDAADSLVFSAGGRSGSGTMSSTAGMTRITNGPSASGSIFGTSYAVVADPTIEFTATEAFSAAGSPATQAVGVFRPASWTPLRFGGLCEDPDALAARPYNGYSVTVACNLNDAGDTLEITATATPVDGGNNVTARATVTRLPSGTIEVTEWDTRPTGGTP